MSARLVGLWERVAPYLAGLGAIAMLAVPAVGYEVIHHSQVQGQQVVRNTQSEVDQIKAVLICQSKAFDGLLQDVPLAFTGDKRVGDYAKIQKHCLLSVMAKKK